MATIDPEKLRFIFRDAITNEDGVKRWMDDGDIVSFTNPKQRFDNAEFEINGQSYWKIWFSQLYAKFYTGDLANPQICSITLKNGELNFPIRLSFPRFWELVKGKRFKVKLDPTPCFTVNKSNQKVKALPFNENDKIYEYVHKKLVEGNMDAVRGMLKSARCYDLVEI